MKDQQQKELYKGFWVSHMPIYSSFINRVRALKKRGHLSWFKLTNIIKEKFTCPICGYNGPFRDKVLDTGVRKHARCPNCGALERHRLRFLVVQTIFEEEHLAKLSMLHFAPEPFFQGYFKKRVERYVTADLDMVGVDCNVDIQNLPFSNGSYDFVYASHVLEHVLDDRKALCEIRRVLKPGGIAILSVPLVGERTIEYSEPNQEEWNHVRAPGLDYFDRYEECFSRVLKYTSDSFSGKYQLFVYEDTDERSAEKCCSGLSVEDGKNIDFVPVCYV